VVYFINHSHYSSSFRVWLHLSLLYAMSLLSRYSVGGLITVIL